MVLVFKCSPQAVREWLGSKLRKSLKRNHKKLFGDAHLRKLIFFRFVFAHFLKTFNS